MDGPDRHLRGRDGRNYVLADAFQSGDLALNGGEGSISLKFEGHSMRSFKA